MYKNVCQSSGFLNEVFFNLINFKFRSEKFNSHVSGSVLSETSAMAKNTASVTECGIQNQIHSPFWK